MKKLITFIILIIFTISLFSEENKLEFTGHDWQKWDEDAKLAYICGMLSAYNSIAETISKYIDNDENSRILSLLNLCDIKINNLEVDNNSIFTAQEIIDKIYNLDPKYLDLPIWYVFLGVCGKLNNYTKIIERKVQSRKIQ